MLIYECNGCGHMECDHFISLGVTQIRCKKCGVSFTMDEEIQFCVDHDSRFTESELKYVWRIVRKYKTEAFTKQWLWQMVKRKMVKVARLDAIISELVKRDLVRLEKADVEGTGRKVEVIVPNADRLLMV